MTTQTTQTTQTTVAVEVTLPDGATVTVHTSRPDCAQEYAEAYAVAQHHLERLCREEAEQHFAHLRTLPKRQQKHWPLRYSATVDTLIALCGDDTLTRERVLGFLHHPEAAGFDLAWRTRQRS